MTIGIIGLGRMGFHMAERLLKGKHKVIAYNRSPEKTRALKQKYKSVIAAYSLAEVTAAFGRQKRIVWLMLPAGSATDDMINALLPLLQKGDIIVNGANAFYKQAQVQSKRCAKYGVHFFDAGVSGGIWGLTRGYALMLGGPKAQFKFIEPFCKTLAPKNGYGYFGESGAGHFVKSVHNIIEYVYLQGLAEGMELLNNFEQKIDLVKAAKTWQPASIVSSALLDWMVTGLERKDFQAISTNIGSVTIEELQETVKAVQGYAPAFETAVATRKDKSKKFALGKRVISATRREFGGHAV
jgi:6-phosphogluconate dehydrogenase